MTKFVGPENADDFDAWAEELDSFRDCKTGDDVNRRVVTSERRLTEAAFDELDSELSRLGVTTGTELYHTVPMNDGWVRVGVSTNFDKLSTYSEFTIHAIVNTVADHPTRPGWRRLTLEDWVARPLVQALTYDQQVIDCERLPLNAARSTRLPFLHDAVIRNTNRLSYTANSDYRVSNPPRLRRSADVAQHQRLRLQTMDLLRRLRPLHPEVTQELIVKNQQ